MRKNKSNVIPFPDRMSRNISDNVMQEMNLHEEAADMATFCIDIIQKAIRKQSHSELSTIDFNDIQTPEHKDMFVILNLLSSMFLRKGGIDHLLQSDLDHVYAKLVTIDYAVKNDVDLMELIDADYDHLTGVLQHIEDWIDKDDDVILGDDDE